MHPPYRTTYVGVWGGFKMLCCVFQGSGLRTGDPGRHEDRHLAGWRTPPRGAF